MSQVRVHNFSISLDGFGTGDGLTREAPFGHAGERLHEWMFATSFSTRMSSVSTVAAWYCAGRKLLLHRAGPTTILVVGRRTT